MFKAAHFTEDGQEEAAGPGRGSAPQEQPGRGRLRPQAADGRTGQSVYMHMHMLIVHIGELFWPLLPGRTSQPVVSKDLVFNNLPNHCGCLSCCPSVPSATQLSGQVEELQAQLEKEASRRSQLERTNGELKEQLASLSSLGHSSDQLERSRRQLEEELLELRRRLEAEHGQAERYRHDVEERARQEVQQKLEQVNLFLQVRPGGSGAAS